MAATTKGGSPSRAASRTNGNGNGKAAGEAARAKAEQAVAEATPEQTGEKTVEYRGHTLTLPAEIPPAVLFDLVELEANDENGMPVFRLLRSLLGSEQFVAVRNALTPDDTMDEIPNVLDLVLGQYGVTLGESSASPDS